MTKNRIAVVTGASGGFGREFVKLFLRDTSIDGIWAIARTQSKLDALRADFGDKVNTFAIDLSDAGAIMDFAGVLEREKPDIAYLINNAGYAKFCSCMDLSIQQSLNMINLNVNGVVAMGLACIPYMKPDGRIANIASQAAFQPLPYMNIYSATKAFVRNYSRALNVELKERGISVTAVCPGWMTTDLLDSAVPGAKKAARRFVGTVSPDKVAEKALEDINRGKAVSVYSLYVKLCHVTAKLLPQRAMMRIWLWQQDL